MQASQRPSSVTLVTFAAVRTAIEGGTSRVWEDAEKRPPPDRVGQLLAEAHAPRQCLQRFAAGVTP